MSYIENCQKLEKNMVMHDKTLSEDEAALYDRQIRLWGLDAQKRLRAANVLIIGACGLGAEVIKNIVLAGVNSLTICDHRQVTEMDTYSNFFVSHDGIGKNLAEASLESAQQLNPMVKVSVSTFALVEINSEYVSQFNVICLCGGTKSEISIINNFCRENGAMFFAGDVFGMRGFSFTDLIDHSYIEEVKEKVKPGEEEADTKLVKKTVSFVPFSNTEVDWMQQKYANRLKRISPEIFVLNILQEFESCYNRRPLPSNREADQVELLTIKNSLLDKIGIPQEKVSNDFVETVFGQLSPVCAVVGGVLGQEIIKAVSKKDEPLNNFFFFSPEEGVGVVEAIGY